MTVLGSTEGGDTLNAAAEALQAGGVVLMPTETVYGLACDATNDTAIARVYAAKGRPSFNPLIVHVAGFEMAARYGVFSPLAQALADQFWPGPLTLVVPYCLAPSGAPIGNLALAGLDTIALRCPAHPMARALIQQVDRPIAAPSANVSGQLTTTRFDDAMAAIGAAVDAAIDGGDCDIGLESTILAVSEGQAPRLLRLGALDLDALKPLCGPLDLVAPDRIEAPGMMLKHYAPYAPLRLNAHAPDDGEVYLGFGDPVDLTFTCWPRGLNLSADGDTVEAAAHLFAYLHRLDSLKPQGIAVAPIPMDGLGAAINDRLSRAAARD